jgi:hypothetical protein
VATNVLGKKSEILFSCVNLRKKPQKRKTIAKVSKPQKLGKKEKKKKNFCLDITNERQISILPLDSEIVETQYYLMVGFKVLSYFRLIILCWIFYLCSKDYQGWFLLNTKAAHSFLFEGRNVWPSLWHAASTRGQSVLHDLPCCLMDSLVPNGHKIVNSKQISRQIEEKICMFAA